ncbi:MAG: 2-pyrone-4,6-dicarboxylate lactonase [Alphaproteobacteria bacterium]|nr:2-pyrone-4,6-dicarboxylate lactonase [Alphaproteobacteria bacterium]
MSQKYAGAARPARAPAGPLPPLSCDCHLHVFGDPAQFPDRHPNPVHKSLEATWEDALKMHHAVGFSRGVFVQPANYMTDHTYLKEALARVPRGQYRATGIIDDSVSDAELEHLHDSGMRGVRFNFVRQFNMAPSPATFHRSVARIRAYGWYVKIFIGAEEIAGHIDTLRDVTSVPVLIDHMGRTPPNHPARRLVVDLVKRENVWMLLSNGPRMSAQAPGWDDMVPLGRELYAAAPDRCIFGTDWPHTHSQKEGGGPEEDAFVGLLYKFLPDAKSRQAVLVDNPARLHGFE